VFDLGDAVQAGRVAVTEHPVSVGVPSGYTQCALHIIRKKGFICSSSLLVVSFMCTVPHGLSSACFSFFFLLSMVGEWAQIESEGIAYLLQLHVTKGHGHCCHVTQLSNSQNTLATHRALTKFLLVVESCTPCLLRNEIGALPCLVGIARWMNVKEQEWQCPGMQGTSVVYLV
jgi:hypothetical protein